MTSIRTSGARTLPQIYTSDPREVPARITALSFVEAARALKGAWRDVLDRDPSVDALSVLLAQSALETGRWRKIWNYNWGNVKASLSYQGHHCYFRCNEIIKGKVEWFSPPHPQTRFRAFPAARTGAAEFLAFLAVDSNGDGYNRYARAWGEVERGDPEAFCAELKRAGYFTAHLASYTKAVVSLFREYRSELNAHPLTERPEAIEQPADDTEIRSAFSDDDLFDRVPWIDLDDEAWARMRAERDGQVFGD